MEKRHTTKAWSQYEAGKEYKRRIGLYETVRSNECFYRGDQWRGEASGDLPKPVFNIIRRIADYLICTVAASDISIRYTSESLPFIQRSDEAEAMRSYIDSMNKNALYRWDKNSMSRKIYSALTDAAVSGDGVFFCYWDKELPGTQEFAGDIATELIDSTDLFVADVNRADIQSQEYIILSGRKSVISLKNEARAHGATEDEVKKIVSDADNKDGAYEHSRYELECEDAEKATYIIKFWKEGGKVMFEKSTRDCVIMRAATDCRLYPVAYFNWYSTKNSFHGTSPISSLIPNQKYLNRAYAMVMKHMTDTAFSKVVYDKSRIPEWSNEVGEAIAAHGGGNMSDAVSVIGVGKLQEHYLELIENVLTSTKDIMGATDSALGDERANNTSAILALQQTSRIPLEQVRSALHKCIEDLANIWADMMCAYYPNERFLISESDEGLTLHEVDFSAVRRAALCARVELHEITRYSAAGTQNMLDKLLDGGHITASQYVSRLPSGLIPERAHLVEYLEEKESMAQKNNNENEKENEDDGKA